MRFILREYLSSLKEDGQLDSFLKQLLLAMKLIPLSTTQKGRQFGVDIPATGKDEDGIDKLFLFVIKQGNFSRKTWDSGNINDIRPSITEILDVYLNTRVPKPYDSLPVKIIVCCNGELEQPVEQNWAQYVNKHTITNKIEFDFWGLYHLVKKSEEFQVNEDLMTPDLALNFQRALAFIDLPDYELIHLQKFLINLLPNKEEKALSDKQAQRKIRLANLCMSIIHNWCQRSNNIKPSYVSAEKIILCLFDWFRGNDLVDRRGLLTDLYALLQNWRSVNLAYIQKTGPFFTISEGIGLGIASHTEYCLLTFEQIGIVSMMGLFEVWEFHIANLQLDEGASERIKYAFDNAEGYANILSRLIQNNPSSLNPRFDEHCIEINMGLILLSETGLFAVAVNWLRQIIDRLILNVRMVAFYPLLNTHPENLDVEKASNQTSTLLGNILAEWCIILQQFDYYSILREFLKSDLQQLDLQLWIPDEKTEDFLYSEDASKKSGSTMISIDLPENYLKQQMNMSEDRVIFNDEKSFYYNKTQTSFLPFLSSRHYRTYPFPNSWRKYLNSKFCFTPEDAASEMTPD